MRSIRQPASLLYHLCGIAVVVVGLSLAPEAHAGDPAPANGGSDNPAKEFFARGSELFAEGQFLEAAKSFESAYAINPHQAVLANIALCYDEGGHTVKAVTTYREYLKSPLDNQPNAKMRSRLAELEEQVGEVDVTCPEADCVVFIDGLGRETDSGLFVLMPGAHQVEGRVGGYVIAGQQVALKAGSRVTVRLKTTPVAPVPATETTQPPSETGPEPMEPSEPAEEEAKTSTKSSARKPGAGFWTFTGIAVASGVTAAILGGATQAKHQEFLDSDQTDEALMEKGQNLKTATNVMIGVAGASAVAAVIFLIVDLKKEKPQKSARVNVGAGPGIGGGFHVQF